jgi:adenylate cyclase
LRHKQPFRDKGNGSEVLRLQPDFSTAEYMRKSVLLEREADRELLREGLLKAGLPE